LPTLSRKRANTLSHVKFKNDELADPAGKLIAIDAEFVALTKEESEIHSDGTRSVVRPSRLGLARVSVLRGEGPDEALPFIDDYVVTSEPIIDYLTEFSGIKRKSKLVNDFSRS
jgi:PAB-dependent poly(A)-specific ribonuclease subunit 2